MTEYRTGHAMGVGRKAALCLSTILCSGLAVPLHAQVAGAGSQPPVRLPLDANGIDVLRGTQEIGLTDIDIGPADQRGLSYSRINGVATAAATIEGSTGSLTVTLNGHSASFTLSGSNYVSTEGDGATLVSQSGIYIYTAADGTIARFTTNQGFAYSFYEGEFARLASVTYPDGATTAFTWKVQTFCPAGYDGRTTPCLGQLYYVARLQSVANSNGYQLKISYASNAVRLDTGNYPDWGRVTAVQAINNAVEYCDPAGDSCTLTGSWPAATYDASGNATDAAGRPVKSYVTTTLDANNRVGTATRDGIAYSYSYADTGTSTRTTTVTDPNGKSRIYVGDTGTFLISSVTDEVSRTTSYTYDGSGRVLSVTAPELNQTLYAYDGRGNVTTTTAKAKPGAAIADIVTTAGYDATCTNPKTCNKPNWTKDAKSSQTDYTYDSNHGGLLTVTRPAATSGGERPQSRYSYAQQSAFIKTSVAAAPSASVATYVLTGVSACTFGTSCTGAANEVKTTIGYGPQVAGTGNNLLPVTTTSGSGDGVLAATTTLAYDAIGNRVTVDGPLAGSGDVSITRYDAARQVAGVIGPDPDGAGPRKYRAVRMTLNADRQPTLIERGTVNGTTDTDWAAFSPLQQVATAYTNRRKTSDTVSATGTTYALTQYAYDALGRLQCSALRMNTALYGSLPGACTQATPAGSFGPDRIVQLAYTDASQLRKTTSGVGTTDVSDDATYTYALNGQVASLTDANNNATSYAYDRFDRLDTTTWPATSSSPNPNYEQLTYDANSNVVNQRLQNATNVVYTYDLLDRVTSRTPPTSTYNLSATYTYDLLGRTKSANNSGGIYSTQSNLTYDALSRVTQQTATLSGGNIFLFRTMAYDLADRRTREDWQDGFYVTYDYDTADEMTAIRENGATSGQGVLATFAYDDLGRRTGLTRGNGVVTAYSYDPASRLTGMATDFTGTANDLTLTFGNYGPVGQIGTRTASNDSYAWTGATNLNRSYTPGPLNQYTAISGLSPVYNVRGNMIGLNGTTYNYASENELMAAGTTRFYYDAFHRLIQTNGSPVVRIEYDGQREVTEYSNSGTTLRRFVHGPGVDEPLVWYEGSGTTDRRWLHADERGSIIATSDGTGSVTATNRYDEYGVPAAGNAGRFQYTGQAWVPELGMYYYKARMYQPVIGRFMQPDPIGYGAGANLYNYVGSDPVNAIDPSGTVAEIVVTGKASCIVAMFCASLNLSDLDRVLRPPVDYSGELSKLQDVEEIVVTARRKDKKSPQKGLINSLASLAKKTVCTLGNIDLGGGADVYAGLGGSVGGSFKFDIGSGQFGADGYVAVGAGLGAEAGPTVTVSSSGNTIVSANLITQVGGGYGVGVVGTRTLLGTSPGSNSVTVGKVGSPIGFVNGGAAIGLHTPKLYDLGC